MMGGVAFLDADLQALAEYLNVPSSKQERLRNAFRRAPYPLLRRAGFPLARNIISEEWLFLTVKERLGCPLSEEEMLWLRLIQFVQSDDLSGVNQGLQLLDSLFSLQEIASFFALSLDSVLAENESLNISGRAGGCFLQAMDWLQVEPQRAGYLLLWFLGRIYEEYPDRLRLEEGVFSFFMDVGDALYMARREKVHFCVIPDNFYALESIQQLHVPPEMKMIPTRLLCLPQLKELLLSEGGSDVECSDYSGLRNSSIAVVSLHNAKHVAVPIPQFIWYLPQLRSVRLYNMGFVFVPEGSRVEELVVDSDLRKSNLNFKPSTALRRVCISLKYRKLDWNWNLPNIEELSLLHVGQFILTEEATSLRRISLKGADVVSLSGLPSLEEFSLGSLYNAYQPNTDAVLLSVQAAPKLRRLQFASLATSWPSQICSWPALRYLDISEWKRLSEIKGILVMPRLEELCCTVQQLKLIGLPNWVPQIHLRESFSVSTEALEEAVSRLTAFPRLEKVIIDIPNHTDAPKQLQDCLENWTVIWNAKRIR